jgi:hypothetical protein
MYHWDQTNSGPVLTSEENYIPPKVRSIKEMAESLFLFNLIRQKRGDYNRGKRGAIIRYAAAFLKDQVKLTGSPSIK